MLCDDGLVKYEGDNCSLVGVFCIGIMFGYVKMLVMVMLYCVFSVIDWCMDVSGVCYYN